MNNIFKKAALVFLALIYIIPFAYLLLLSFAREWRFPQVFPAQTTLSNWKGLLINQSGLLHSFLLSLCIALTVAFLSTVFGFFTSKAIAAHPQRHRLMMLVYLPFILSPVIYAVMLNYFFILMNLSATLAGVIIGQLFITYPFSIILLIGFWDKRASSLEELVYTLGGNSWQAYKKVLLPVAKGILLICFFQDFLISWFEYGLTTVIGAGQIQTLTLKVFAYVSEANMYYAALSSCLIILPPAIFLWLNKQFVFAELNEEE